MSYEKACRKKGCGMPGILISLFFGLVIGILYALGFIPNIETTVWVAFGLGALSFAFEIVEVDLAALNTSTSLYKAVAHELNCLLTGTLGTVVTSLALLSFDPVSTSIVADVLVGLDAFFFAFMFIEWIILFNRAIYHRSYGD